MQGQEGLAGPADHRLALIHEMSAQNFDLIRFASYRTAIKLRFIQKKVSLHAVDIWNVIEAFREHGLNTLEPASELSVARLETLLCSLFHSLNKRVPPAQQVHVDACSGLLLNWLLAAYATVDNVGKIRVFSIKVALATLCAGKLMDKLRYIFSQVSDSNGLLMMWRFAEYLQEVLALPAAVYESPTFYYNDVLPATIFNPNAKITVNDFMDTMMSDPGPPALVWLPLLHRIATVENVIHAVVCDACQKENFTGFRYRCQKCPHYTLCQECFWRGRVSPPHALDHQVKEYSTFSPSKTIGHTLRKSFRCVPEKQKNNLPRFPDQPEKTLNLSHIVPPSPLPSHNGFPDGPFNGPFDMGSLDSRSTARSLDSGRDDEHRLIARYAAKLKQEARSNMPRQQQQQQQQQGPHRTTMLSPDGMQGRVPSEACLGMDSTRAQRELISQLENKNREIMREIARLRRQQEMEASGHGPENPALMTELRALRLRKDELETHLSTLQDSRRQLMVQLEGLMKMLKNHQSSPRSTPNSSPRSTKSPPLPPGVTPTTSQAAPLPGPRSAPQTPLGPAPPTTQGMCPTMGITQSSSNAHLQQQQQQQQQQQNLQQNAANEDKSKQLDKSDKPTKVRHTRWNDEPAVVAPVLSLLNPAFAGTMSGNPFSSLNPQDQQKIQEYQLNYQLKGFYSEQDQDMRINSNGDVDMRALPQIIPQPTEPAEINFEQYKHDAGLTSNMSEPNEQMMDTDIRNFGAEPISNEIEEPQMIVADKTEFSPAKKEDVTSDSSANMGNLTIDEKAGDSGSELPSNLPKKQRELFLRIQAQQKENIPENQHANDDSPILKDDDWYSSDDDNDPLSKMVIHLEDESKEDEDTSQQSPSDNHTSSPPPIKPVEVIDKLGDLSKIDISAEVTKLLTSIKTGQAPNPSKQESTSYETPNTSTTLPIASISDVLKRRDPRQAVGKTVDMEIKSPIMSTDRVKSFKGEPRDARLSIYEQGIVNPDEANQLSIYDQGMIDDAAKEDVDLRNLDALAKDLDMRPSFGDTDLRQGGGAGVVGRKDVDLRQLGLQFKAMQNYTPATEIDASHNSHPNILWKLYIVNIPRPDYSGLKLQAQDAQVVVDPRLRKIFRVQSSEEKDSPASPKQQQPQQPQKSARQDPRRRNVLKDDSPPKSDVTNLSYSQQLQLLQNSAFYQSLTSSQKVMLNQEIALKGEQNPSNDPILAGILSSLGLIQSLNNQNGSAMNILANVNSLVPNLNPGLMPPNMGNMGQNMNQNIGQSMGAVGPNMGVGMVGNMGQNINAMGSNLSQMPPQNMGQMGPNLGPMGQNMGPNMGQPMGPNIAGPGLNPALGQNMGGMNPNMGQGMMPMNPNVPNSNMGNIGPGLLGAAPGIPIGPQMGQNEFQINFDPRNGGLLGPAPFQNFPENQNFQYNEEFYPNSNDDNNFNNSGNQNYNNNSRNNDRNFRGDRNSQGGGRRGRSWNNRNNNSRNFNRNNNNNRNRSNRSYTPP